MNPSRLSSVLLSAAVVLLLASCGNAGDASADDSPGADAPGDGTDAHVPTTSPAEPDVTELPGSEDVPSIPFPEQDAELVEEMTSEVSGAWMEYEVLSETQLRFLSWSGNQACYGQRYELQETAEEVAVAIITGWRADAAEVCTEEALAIAITVDLEEPLGDREVVELEDPELNTQQP